MSRLLNAVLIWLFLAGAALADCAPGAVNLRGAWGQARFSVEVADTPAERAKGLMNRASLPRSAGMLFVYEEPGSPAFWMRNTLIPLDMLFVDATGRVTRIHEKAVPHDETPIPGGDGVLVVLEINGGLARQLGITEGSEMRSAVFDQETALWPCNDK